MDAAISVIGIFFFMILIFVAAYYGTKFLGKHYSPQASFSDNMRVVDRMPLGRDQYLLIVEAGGKALLIGVSPQRIEALAELDKDHIADQPAELRQADFFSLFKSRWKKPGGSD